MNSSYLNTPEISFFSDAQEQFNEMIKQLQSSALLNYEHGDIESVIKKEGFELLRRFFQGWLDIKSCNETDYCYIISSTEQKLNHVKPHRERKITSLFGNVITRRKSYSQRQQSRQFPIDEQLNLPKDQYSDGLRKQLAKEVIKNSFDNAVEAIDETTGGHIPKRQSLKLAQDIVQDFEGYYQQQRLKVEEKTSDLLVLSFDGKGIVMRSEGLRECTQKAAKKSKKLESRLSAGEKKNRKRIAQVATVYTTLANSRSATNIMKKENEKVSSFHIPTGNKRVWASVEREAEVVIEEAFLEALIRDSKQKRQWVILIDGHPHQIKLIKKVMQRLKVKATIVMDFIHVLEYLWKAAWCFFEKGDDAVENWISHRAIKILEGKCSQVAKGIRISATKLKLDNRGNVEKCADYLIKNKERLKYGEALKSGFPIASGVIEGACRHLINDRLDITGARWSLKGAESILKLRSLKSSGHFEDDWNFHKKESKRRLYNFVTVDKLCA